jgi:hypothetical protein
MCEAPEGRERAIDNVTRCGTSQLGDESNSTSIMVRFRAGTKFVHDSYVAAARRKSTIHNFYAINQPEGTIRSYGQLKFNSQPEGMIRPNFSEQTESAYAPGQYQGISR